MKTIQIYKVYPAIPEPLRFLGDLARNLWWCWNDDAIDLFRRIRPEQWEKVGKNPVVFLAHISQHRYEILSRDESFLGHLARVKARFEAMSTEMSRVPDLTMAMGSGDTVAYFSMEFGLHESLPFLPGAWGCWPVIISRPLPHWAFR